MLPCSVVEALQQADRKHLELAGIGCFAQVFKIGDTGLAIKQTFDHPVVGNLQHTEKRIYERLVIIIHIFCDTTVNTVRAMAFQTDSYFNINLRAPLRRISHCQSIQRNELRPMQAAQALQFIHGKNVIHSDFGSHNFLVQEDGSLALADFGGSRIDGTSAVISYSTRYARPCVEDLDSTGIDDLFALGTVIYEISVGHPLYADRSSREVRKLLRQHEFPDLNTINPRLRVIIKRCWSNGYRTADEVVHDVKATSSPSVVLWEW